MSACAGQEAKTVIGAVFVEDGDLALPREQGGVHEHTCFKALGVHMPCFWDRQDPLEVVFIMLKCAVHISNMISMTKAASFVSTQ